LIGGAIGIVAVILLNLYVSRVESEQSAVQVFRLKPDVGLARGDAVTREQVEIVGLPARFADVVKQAVPATPDAGSWLKGRPVTQDVSPGSLLLYAHFEEKPQERFAAKIAEGMRAISIPVEPATAVSFFVEPGSSVDVLATMREDQPLDPDAAAKAAQQGRLPRNASISTRTLLQNVRVLAVGRAITRGSYVGDKDGEFDTVTVEVTPLQAEKIVFALEHTEPKRELHLVLRNPTDTQEVRLPTVDWDDLGS
jgi:Flp pilus assembly protein CpaB